MITVRLISGANIEPTRADVEPAPNPALRITVGNCSVEKI